jgi:hypothetical protein
VLPAVARLLLPHAVALAHVGVGVGEERVGEAFLPAERFLPVERILGDAEDLGVGATDLGEGRLEVARLLRSA